MPGFAHEPEQRRYRAVEKSVITGSDVESCDVLSSLAGLALRLPFDSYPFFERYNDGAAMNIREAAAALRQSGWVAWELAVQTNEGPVWRVYVKRDQEEFSSTGGSVEDAWSLAAQFAEQRDRGRSK